MERPLVLTNDAARHWLRRMLPPAEPMIGTPEPMSDGKLFLLAFCAAFLAVYGFIA